MFCCEVSSVSSTIAIGGGEEGRSSFHRKQEGERCDLPGSKGGKHRVDIERSSSCWDALPGTTSKAGSGAGLDEHQAGQGQFRVCKCNGKQRSEGYYCHHCQEVQ